MTIFGGSGRPNDKFIMDMARAKGNVKAPPAKKDGGKGKATTHKGTAAEAKHQGRVHLGAMGTAKKALK